MRVLIAGMDGYLGWPLAQYLTARGHEVAGADAFYRRRWVEEMDSHSAIPVAEISDRLRAFEAKWDRTPLFREGDLTDWEFVKNLFQDFKPHAGMCCNFQKAASERLVGSIRLRLMQPPRTAC